MTTIESTVDRTRFARAAALVRELGYWDGKTNQNSDNPGICGGLAVIRSVDEAGRSGPFAPELEFLARQLGWDGDEFSGDGIQFIYDWNDRVGQDEVLSTLDRLARGEPLV